MERKEKRELEKNLMIVKHFYGFFGRVAGFTVVWASEDDIGLVITIHGHAYIKLEIAYIHG